MSYPADLPVTAFDAGARLSHGPLELVVADVVRLLARAPEASPFVFHDRTGERLELDLRGSPEEAAARLLAPAGDDVPASEAAAAPRGPGRPKLGVVPREVTLLPRHWAWLATQPGGASATLRRLVEDARRTSEAADGLRRSQEAAYRFMLVMAGDLPGYEEALRAVYGGDALGFESHTSAWPEDVRAYARNLAFPGEPLLSPGHHV